jgi:hypothetical protein
VVQVYLEHNSEKVHHLDKKKYTESHFASISIHTALASYSSKQKIVKWRGIIQDLENQSCNKSRRSPDSSGRDTTRPSPMAHFAVSATNGTIAATNGTPSLVHGDADDLAEEDMARGGRR